MSSRFDSGSPQVKTALAWAQSISLKDINTSSTVGLAMMRDFMTPDISIVTRPACIEFPVLKSVDEYIDLMEGAFFPIFNECNTEVQQCFEGMQDGQKTVYCEVMHHTVTVEKEKLDLLAIYTMQFIHKDGSCKIKNMTQFFDSHSLLTLMERLTHSKD